MENLKKKMLKDYTTTPTLLFKQHQNIAQSHFPPTINVLAKKLDNLRLMLQSSV
jgi:hypothetical protein